MQNKLSMFLIFLLVVLGFNPIGRIYSNEPVSRGEELEFYINIENRLNENFKGMNVRATFYDFGEVADSTGFDIEKKSARLTRIFWEVPKNAPCGEHVVKITASNDKIRDSKHVFLDVDC